MGKLFAISDSGLSIYRTSENDYIPHIYLIKNFLITDIFFTKYNLIQQHIDLTETLRLAIETV